MIAAELARRLRQAREAGEVSGELLDALLAHLDHCAANAEARAACVLANRQADLEAMRRGVDAAIGALSAPGQPLQSRVAMVLSRIRRRTPAAYNLPREPGVRLIAQRLRVADRATVPKLPAQSPIQPSVRATLSSTFQTS